MGVTPATTIRIVGKLVELRKKKIFFTSGHALSARTSACYGINMGKHRIDFPLSARGGLAAKAAIRLA
jgi:hypothetical protein